MAACAGEATRSCIEDRILLCKCWCPPCMVIKRRSFGSRCLKGWTRKISGSRCLSWCWGLSVWVPKAMIQPSSVIDPNLNTTHSYLYACWSQLIANFISRTGSWNLDEPDRWSCRNLSGSRKPVYATALLCKLAPKLAEQNVM